MNTEEGDTKIPLKDAVEMGCRGVAMIILPALTVADQMGGRRGVLEDDD